MMTARLLFTLVVSSMVSCNEPIQSVPVNQNNLAVEIPAGLVMASEAQSRLVASAKKLSVGMSQQEVKNRLGTNVEEAPGSLFYKEEEGLEGGHSVTLTLIFEENGLRSAKVGFGHTTRLPRTSEP